MAMATSSSAVSPAAAQAQGQIQTQEATLKGAHHLAFPVFSKSRSRALAACTSKPSSRLRPNYLIPVRAVATTQDTIENVSAAKVSKYHFLVANAKFMLDEEEHFQELMRERLRLFGERNKEQDFWLVIEPQFLEKFPDITKRLKRPAVALVSTDELWITFMKLRLDRVLRGEIEAESVTDALKSNPVEINFEKPQTWTAPYSKYEGRWWTPFLPPAEH
ncbi:hypothetical protein GOP47_0015226 [Adiantum capillus-veneris]|uniref:Ycf54-like protein n=1 Tax=Adiantum capillus-veneris TaxID=13818 RepID=A0A9D4UJC8_ADICA|nr:hypothetical protein GOP47_0015226 [Adiantum capillus-veneris]